jgi:hypothetical protein
MVEVLCTHVENGTTRPIETVLKIGGGGIKGNDGAGGFD